MATTDSVTIQGKATDFTRCSTCGYYLSKGEYVQVTLNYSNELSYTEVPVSVDITCSDCLQKMDKKEKEKEKEK